MYWWRLAPLCDDLVADRVTERDRFLYFMLMCVLPLAVFPLLLQPELAPSEAWEWWDHGLNSALILAGAWWWYLANGGGAGRDFLARVVAIGWVITVRTFVVMVPLEILALELSDQWTAEPWYGNVYPVVCWLGSYSLFSAIVVLAVARTLTTLRERDRIASPSPGPA
jgi:hypothetical protein